MFLELDGLRQVPLDVTKERGNWTGQVRLTAWWLHLTSRPERRKHFRVPTSRQIVSFLQERRVQQSIVVCSPRRLKSPKNIGGCVCRCTLLYGHWPSLAGFGIDVVFIEQSPVFIG